MKWLAVWVLRSLIYSILLFTDCWSGWLRNEWMNTEEAEDDDDEDERESEWDEKDLQESQTGFFNFQLLLNSNAALKAEMKTLRLMQMKNEWLWWLTYSLLWLPPLAPSIGSLPFDSLPFLLSPSLHFVHIIFSVLFSHQTLWAKERFRFDCKTDRQTDRPKTAMRTETLESPIIFHARERQTDQRQRWGQRQKSYQWYSMQLGEKIFLTSAHAWLK